MAQHIIVVDYDPCWEQKYLAEAKTIRAILGENCTAIFHIGSTAVKGLKAKPIIDIMPVVRDIAAVDEKQGAFEGIGYEYLGEFGMARRRYLRKGGDERTHQVHIFQETDRANIERHLAVRRFPAGPRRDRPAVRRAEGNPGPPISLRHRRLLRRQRGLCKRPGAPGPALETEGAFIYLTRRRPDDIVKIRYVKHMGCVRHFLYIINTYALYLLFLNAIMPYSIK